MTICQHCHRVISCESLLPTTASNKLTCPYCAYRWINRGGRSLRERNRRDGLKYTGRADYKRYSKQWGVKIREIEKDRQSYKGRWWTSLEIGG